MSNAIVNGKKPLSQKPKATPIAMDDIFGNQLGVEPAILEAIKAKGMDYRFVNAKQLTDMGGYHPHGWRPLKLSEIECDKINLHSFQFGNDPDKYIRRGDAILAVRPTETGDKHRAYLKQEAERAKQIQKTHADELRALAKRSGGGMTVHEGYEENE